MKKYRLQDLVANGSRARREVQSDLLVGDTSHGYGYGDILDANATKELIAEKVQEATGNVSGDVAGELNSLREKDEEYENRIDHLENRFSVDNGDNLIIG